MYEYVPLMSKNLVLEFDSSARKAEDQCGKLSVRIKHITSTSLRTSRHQWLHQGQNRARASL